MTIIEGTECISAREATEIAGITRRNLDFWRQENPNLAFKVDGRLHVRVKELEKVMAAPKRRRPAPKLRRKAA